MAIEDEHVLIVRQKKTGRVFSLSFDLQNDKGQLINGLSMLLNTIGMESSEQELHNIDMEIQLLLEKKRILTGSRDCLTCKGK